MMAVLAACSSSSARSFDDVHDAGRRAEALLAGDGDIAQYRQALSAFTAKLDALKAKPLSSRDQARAARYDAVRQALDDVRLVWEEKDARKLELLPIAEPLPGRLQKTYGLPVNTNEPPSIYATEARQLIGAAAREKLNAIKRE
jgi:hypothetical protein